MRFTFYRKWKISAFPLNHSSNALQAGPLRSPFPSFVANLNYNTLIIIVFFTCSLSLSLSFSLHIFSRRIYNIFYLAFIPFLFALTKQMCLSRRTNAVHVAHTAVLERKMSFLCFVEYVLKHNFLVLTVHVGVFCVFLCLSSAILRPLYLRRFSFICRLPKLIPFWYERK